MQELLCQDQAVDDNNIPETQEFPMSRKRVRNVLKKRRPQPVGGLVNMDERMNEMVDLVGREPGTRARG